MLCVCQVSYEVGKGYSLPSLIRSLPFSFGCKTLMDIRLILGAGDKDMNLLQRFNLALA
jgi:hypothetical protein